jgi:uroporphyrinogen decarboxylase
VTSRERILTAMNHQEPDRVPRDLGATPSSGISAIAYNRLIAYKEFPVGPAKVYDVVQQLAQPDEVVLDHYRIDVVDIGRTFNDLPTDWKMSKLPDCSDAFIPSWFNPVKQIDGSMTVFSEGLMIAKMPKGTTFYDGTYVAYPDEIPNDLSDLDMQMDRVLWQKMVHSPWDHASELDFWQQLRTRTKKLREQSDRALMIVCGCNLFEWGTFLRRIDNFLCDLLLDPEGVERLLDALMDRHLRTLEKVCESVGDLCDVLRFGDDLGMDTGPMMKPEIYRKLFKPRHAMLNDYVHKHSSMKTLIHSCGSIYSLLPDIIEAGYDVINPVQINSRDMDPVRLKREFGKDITFWGGGADTRSVLNQKSPEEVKDHVRSLIETFAPGGGFVFNTVHNIMPDVPPENIDAMFEAVNEY